MFRSLTPFQQSLIKEYKKLADRVYFHGIDQNVLPVISYDDANGHRDPFAIRPRAVRVADAVYMGGDRLSLVQRERTVTEPAYPLRWFTEEELDFIDPDSHYLITSLDTKTYTRK